MSLPTTRAPAARSSKPRCDLCLKKDKWKTLKLLMCRTCGVHVHEECYGLVSPDADTFECWPCRAVATDIEGRTLKGKLRTMVVSDRPRECVLCSFSGGNHAMHPLYDEAGPEGRHVILPAQQGKPKRLAWVHSLCAFGVCGHRGTGGAVYGCDEDGVWQGDESMSEEAGGDGESEQAEVTETHHFVMCGLDGEEDGYTKLLKDHREELVCVICGSHDKNSLRVPLQCCAGDEQEFPDFKIHHQSVGDACTQAMHVGCAMWGTRGALPVHRRMWFFPGCISERQNVQTQEPVVEIFCDLHAKQLEASETSMMKRAEADESAGTTILQRTAGLSSESREPPPFALSKEAKRERLEKRKASKQAESNAEATKKAVEPAKNKRKRDTTDATKIAGTTVSIPRKEREAVQKENSQPSAAPPVARPSSNADSMAASKNKAPGQITDQNALKPSNSAAIVDTASPPSLSDKPDNDVVVGSSPAARSTDEAGSSEMQLDHQDEDVGFLEDVGQSQPQPHRRERRQNISEEKMGLASGVDYYTGMFDDVADVVHSAISSGEDAQKRLDSRRSFWEGKVASKMTDFDRIWRGVELAVKKKYPVGFSTDAVDTHAGFGEGTNVSKNGGNGRVNAGAEMSREVGEDQKSDGPNALSHRWKPSEPLPIGVRRLPHEESRDVDGIVNSLYSRKTKG